MIFTQASDFARELPTGGRLAGLDLGTKLTGVAFCDAQWHFATPAAPVAKAKFAKELATFTTLFATEAVKGIVIGLPLSLDGSDSARTQSVRAYARNLAALGLPILLWDERWSTAAVERAMIAADVSRAKRSARVDSAAAAWILQGAIDAVANLSR